MDELEQHLDRELKRLPAPRAPETLLPRVLLAVADAESAPWYSRAWITWPRGLQVGSAAMLGLVITGIWQLMAAGWPRITTIVTPVVDHAATSLAPAAHWAAQVSALGRVVSEALLQPMALYFLALLIALSLLCTVLWTAVNRLALGGASSQ